MTKTSIINIILAFYNWFVLLILIIASTSSLGIEPGGAHSIIAILGTAFIFSPIVLILGIILTTRAFIRKVDKKKVVISLFVAHGVYLAIYVSIIIKLSQMALSV